MDSFVEELSGEAPYLDPYEMIGKQWQKIISWLDNAIDEELAADDFRLAILYARILEQVALASTGDLAMDKWNEDLLK